MKLRNASYCLFCLEVFDSSRHGPCPECGTTVTARLKPLVEKALGVVEPQQAKVQSGVTVQPASDVGPDSWLH